MKIGILENYLKMGILKIGILKIKFENWSFENSLKIGVVKIIQNLKSGKLFENWSFENEF